MAKCRITVLKRTLHQDLAEQYCNGEVGPCPHLEDGQEFICNGLEEKPEGLCDWAWRDIYSVVVTMMAGGNFAGDIFDGYMKDEKTMITCCTDGIRPVIFKVERL